MIKELHQKLLNKEVTIKDIVDNCLNNIQKYKDKNIFLEVYNDIDIQIKKAQEMFDRGIIPEPTVETMVNIFKGIKGLKNEIKTNTIR